MFRLVLCLVVFWNVENYFDPFDDPLTRDESFTPQGYFAWTWNRFIKKRNDLAKTIIACGLQDDGTWEAPCIVGLCEIENFFVLYQLVTDSPLAPLEYGIIHRDSPDPRGIDVALLYKKSLFRPLKVGFYLPRRTHIGATAPGALPEPDGALPTRDSASASAATREILYVKGVYAGRDTLHFFVNHWPSKLGGTAAEALRMSASQVVQQAVDSILTKYPLARIVVMGDFNDSPKSAAVRSLEKDRLVNVSAGNTYKYRGAWDCIDQFLVTPSVQESLEYVKVVRLPFLLEPDPTYMGQKPRRTYLGPAYKGGISDHLPISLKIITFTDYVQESRKHPAYEAVFCP